MEMIMNKIMKNNGGFLILLSCLFLGTVTSLWAKAKSPVPPQRVEKYSLTEGKPVFPKAKKARLPFVIYGDESGKQTPFVPSGYMGDGSSLKVTNFYESAPLLSGEEGKRSLRVVYSAKGKEGWTGIYWLSPANNWGKIKGAGFDFSRAKRLTFWVRGEKGGEVIKEIKIGGISTGAYPDSGSAELGPLKLSQDWEQYAIDISQMDARHIVGGFVFILRRVDNRRGCTFYLDEIVVDSGKVTEGIPLLVEDFENPEKLRESSEDLVSQPIRKVIPFDTAITVFDSAAKSVLGEVLNTATRDKDVSVIVEGHTDSLGPASFNMKLSRERAQAVADYLANQGLERRRMRVIGYGEERPVSPESNQSPEGRKSNRRVEVVLVKE